MHKGKIRPLRVLIYEKYDSESKMAETLGWSKQKLNRITNGLKEPNVQELERISQCLDKSLSEIAQIFLDYISPNGDENEAG